MTSSRQTKQRVNIWWLRRDLRLEDNAALYHALQQGIPVQPVFIFDTNILDDLPSKDDKRVAFIHAVLLKLQEQLSNHGASLDVFHGTPREAFEHYSNKYKVVAVHTANDYEPYARERDSEVAKLLALKGIAFHSWKDQVIFEKEEILKDDGRPYTVFTPYSKKWKARLNDFYIKSYPTSSYFTHFYQQEALAIPGLKKLGFNSDAYKFEWPKIPSAIIKNYDKTRDTPAIAGTSRLSLHLRFGTISIRALAREALRDNETYLNELIWRDFYQMILWHFPHVVGHAFKPAYDHIPWRNNEEEFDAWKTGQTGYPIVDAGMRELNTTGYMHNRVRMIVASFLSKHLLIDWRWGEAYFAEKLMDYDLAANNGGWQWAAGSGCDAAPYFRVFNPALQTQKFDPKLEYVKKWVPELDSFDYPQPIVAHDFARKRALDVYKKALNEDQ